ncbi:MAG: M28 family peptidase [bacterium]|nr:M28 family peptidase [bacterium]
MKVNAAILVVVFAITAFQCESSKEVKAEQEGMSKASELADISDTLRIYNHLKYLTKSDQFRNFQNVARLDSVAAYIFREFEQYADTTFYQEYEVDGNVYRNVICSFGTQNSTRTIVGAHYDVCGAQEGADDNASGVVGLLELARLFHDDTLNERIDLVAYTLEEPPFFRTKNMGSYVHAKSLVDDSVNVSGMVCLEMIGYFDDEKGSQEYPVGGMKAVYGSKGDYIALVSQMGPGKFVSDFNKRFNKTKRINTKEIAAPKSMTGIDFSDHLNYWLFGFKALMITDTAFFRNKHYHEKSDTMEKLDLARMADVIDAVYFALR